MFGFALDGHGPLGSLLYPPLASSPSPDGAATVFLMGSVLAQALGLGIALAMLPHASSLVETLARTTGGRRGLAVSAFASIEWMLGSWVPHVGLHQHVAPTNLWALAAIEWGFHATIVLGALILARYLHAANAHAFPVQTAGSPNPVLGEVGTRSD